MLRMAIAFSQIGATDCENIGDGLLRQPVNTISSLAFSGFGVAALISARRFDGVERPIRQIFGWLMIATGVGSFLFHGPQWPFSHFLHDITFLTTLWFIAMANITVAGRLRHAVGRNVFLVGSAAIAATLLILPDSTNVLMVATVIALVAGDIVARRRGNIGGRSYTTALVLVALALALNILGRTGGPWCDTDSLLQGHSAWHVLGAAALYIYFMATSGARTKGAAERLTS